MKLIPGNSIKGNISEAESILRERGILATDASEYANIPTYGVAAKSIKKGVWIHLHHQYDDALKVLKNPSHVVATALSQEEMTIIEQAAKQALFSASSTFFSKVATAVFVSALLALLVYVIYGVSGA